VDNNKDAHPQDYNMSALLIALQNHQSRDTLSRLIEAGAGTAAGTAAAAAAGATDNEMSCQSQVAHHRSNLSSV
jgi:hypothetical protein